MALLKNEAIEHFLGEMKDWDEKKADYTISDEQKIARFLRILRGEADCPICGAIENEPCLTWRAMTFLDGTVHEERKSKHKMENTQNGSSIAGRQPDEEVARGEGADVAALKAGPELDRRVAAAVGITYPLHPDGRIVALYDLIPKDTVEVSATDERIPNERIPMYSMVLDHAFAAADKVGLWEMHRLKPGKRRSWVMRELLDGDATLYACGPTAAVAICAAILKLKHECVMENDVEIDRQVAEAVGIAVRRREPLGDESHDYITAEGHLFDPSTNLNAAFQAAELVRLWESYVLCRPFGEQGWSRHGWAIWHQAQFASVALGGYGESFCEARSIAAAICAAILKFTSGPNSHGA